MYSHFLQGFIIQSTYSGLCSEQNRELWGITKQGLPSSDAHFNRISLAAVLKIDCNGSAEYFVEVNQQVTGYGPRDDGGFEMDLNQFWMKLKDKGNRISLKIG